MAGKSEKLTQRSAPDEVDAYMNRLKHPMADVVAALRATIVKIDKGIGEEIKWNAPAFFYTGPMKPSDPKKYERYLVILNLFKKDCIRLVFWNGARAKDKTGFLGGDYKDGRRLAMIHSVKEVAANKKVLTAIVRAQLAQLDK